MKVALLGFGSAGQRHYKALVSLGQREVMVYDPRVTEEMEGRVVSDSPEAVIAAADAVVVASPASEHSTHLLLAMSAGKPTFVEKPLALTADDSTLAAAVALAERNGTLVQVGYQLRCHEAALAVRRAIDLLGTPRHARFYVGSDMSRWPGSTYADALLECSHEVDAALWLLGPATVEGAVSVLGHTWELLLRHESGCATTLHLSGGEEPPLRLWRVQCERGDVSWAWSSGMVIVQERGGGSAIAWHSAAPEAENALAYRRELELFLVLAAGGGRIGGVPAVNPCDLEDGLAALRACDLARRKAL
jgi:predicted dehydrogenase